MKNRIIVIVLIVILCLTLTSVLTSCEQDQCGICGNRGRLESITWRVDEGGDRFTVLGALACKPCRDEKGN